MYSNRKIPDDLYSDAWNAQAYEAEPRRSRHWRDQTRRTNDADEDYNSHIGPSTFLQPGNSEYRNASSQPYYDAPSQRYDETPYYEPDHRNGSTYAHGYKDNYNGSHRGRGARGARKYSSHRVDPSMSVNYRRTPSKCPSLPPIPTSPSPEYLAIAAEPSEPISSPSRKLIILDLNGTLLVRLRSVGAVYPRPYMPAFRDFLLGPATRQWLDVMVWSSAQPHNVDRMVQRCFFDARLGQPPPEPDSEQNTQSEIEKKDKWDGKIAAVWARDTLGLSSRDYSRKSQTTKDLEKPWAALPGEHSARTTFLLDDSPAKARLQPFNHVCINEYTPELRDHDVCIKKNTRKYAKNTGGLTKVDQVGEGQEEEKAVPTEDGERETGSLTQSEKVRKKKKKNKKKKRQAKIDAAAQQNFAQQDVAQQGPAKHEQEEYDTTLLAVIGVLDALKHESNVAGWIRAGGLWAGKTPSLATKESNTYTEDRKRLPSPTDAEVDEVPAPLSPSQVKRQRSTGSGADAGDMKRTKFNVEEGVSDETPVAAGNDAQTIGVVTDVSESIYFPASNGIERGRDGSSHEAPCTKMWFEDEETFRLWVGRGRAALKELGIDERDGIYCE